MSLKQLLNNKSPTSTEMTFALSLLKHFNWIMNMLGLDVEVMISPIDRHFALNDGPAKTFQYNPRKEATVEFIRLSLQAGWIKELPVWDITNWDQSLKEFEMVWSDKTARQERGKFKEACFYEFDQVYPPKLVN